MLAYSIWLSEIKFEIQELPANHKLLQAHTASADVANNENSPQKPADLNGQKEKLFFMLLGLSLEHLSNTTGLAQLSDETIEDILESIHHLLKTTLAGTLLISKSVYLCVEILSILYK